MTCVQRLSTEVAWLSSEVMTDGNELVDFCDADVGQQLRRSQWRVKEKYMANAARKVTVNGGTDRQTDRI